jgi:hypothetical protein
MTKSAYLIDPWTRTVERVERTAADPSGELHEIYSLMQCDCIEAVRPHNAGSDLLYVDEDGKLKDAQAFFFCRLWPQEPLAGRALWVGTTPDGDDASPTMPLDMCEDISRGLIDDLRRF